MFAKNAIRMLVNKLQQLSHIVCRPQSNIVARLPFNCEFITGYETRENTYREAIKRSWFRQWLTDMYTHEWH